MAVQLFKNNAHSTLNGTLSIGGTTLNVAVGHGSRFPTPSAGEYFLITLYEKDGSGNEINYEVVKVTAITGDSLTIVRDFEGLVVANGGTSGGWAFPSAPGINPSGVVYIEMRYTAYSAANTLNKDANLLGLTSPSDARTNLGLGSIATQNANNVAITGGTITGVTLQDSDVLLVDNTDPTKKVQFELSGLTTATTRTLTVPNTSITLAGTNVDNAFAAAQTFPNSGVKVKGSSTGVTSLNSANTSASNYTTTLPAANTTVPIASQQLTFSGPTADRTYTLPDSSDTLAATGTANTFSQTQTISSGNLTLSGTGQRITGDFSNATVANRVMFQTSTVNGNTVVSAIPNGTAVLSGFYFYGSSDPANSSITGIQQGSTSSQIVAFQSGTGTYLPMTFYTGGSERMRIGTSGHIGVSGTPYAWASTGSHVAVDVGNSGAIWANTVSANPFSGIAHNAYYDGTNWRRKIASGAAQLLFGNTGTAAIYTAATSTADSVITMTAALSCDSSGNVLAHNPAGGLGYGTGSGGTVTQATSKSTAVTLNKPVGKITLASDALGAGATTPFNLNNSLVTGNDVCVLSISGGTSSAANYSLSTYCASGIVGIAVKNETAGSLSEAIVLNFAIIKGAVA